MSMYHFEIYTLGPAGERAWDIKTGWVKARSLAFAKHKVKVHFHGDFDVFIDIYEASPNATDLVDTDVVLIGLSEDEAWQMT